MATVRQSGGDYGSLNAACAAAETTIDIDQSWTVADTTKATISTTGTTITVSGPAKHPGYWKTADNHYRLSCTGGHCLTLSGNFTATIEGISIEQAGTGSSDECFRCVPGTAHTVTIRRSLFRCANNTDQQDCIYTGFNTSFGTITLSQCVFQGAARAGVHCQNSYQGAETGTININSCTLWNNGRGGSNTNGQRGGGIYVSRSTGDRTGITVNDQNIIAVGNTSGNAGARDFGFETATSVPVWNISNSIDSDNSIATVISAGSNNLASRTPTDSDTPGAGDWVVFQDITSAPFDLRLKDNAENDAQDAHATATAHGLTIPSTDIVGTARPQNTNYDIGAFEIAAGGPVTKQITDTASGADLTPSIAVTFGLSDTGAGADSNVVEALLAILDAASGLDGSPTINVSIPIPDFGGGSDTQTITASFGIADTASALDAIPSILAILALADTATGTDTNPTITVNLPLTDAGTGTDAIPVINVSFGLSDTANGADIVALVGLVKAITDAATGTDAIPVLVASLALTDAGTGVDSTPTITVSVGLGDTASGIDTVALLNFLAAITDAATGTDAVPVITVTLPLTDAGTGTDAPTITVSLGVTDTATASDLVALVGIIKAISDSATGTDAVPIISAQVGLTEAAMGGDSQTIAVTLGLTDIGAGTDAGGFLGLLAAISDAATGADSNPVITVVVPVTDTGTGGDSNPVIQALIALIEAGGGTDVAVGFDAAYSIATISFTLANRGISFTLAKRNVTFTLH